MQQPQKYDALAALASTKAQDPAMAALAGFQDWLMDLRVKGLVKVEERVVSLDPVVCRRFVMGAANRRFFVGLDGSELDWAQSMPWTHAAYHRGAPRLYLVCDEVGHAHGVIERFAIEIQVTDAKQLAQLEQLDQIDIRKVQGDQIHAGAFRVLPLWLLEDGKQVLHAQETNRLKRAAA